MTHADVERLLRTEGTELLRRLFQGHLDARGVGEAAGAVVGSDGKARTHARVSDRALVRAVTSSRTAGYHRRALGPRRRGGDPPIARPARERRLRRVLDLPRATRARAPSRRQIRRAATPDTRPAQAIPPAPADPTPRPMIAVVLGEPHPKESQKTCQECGRPGRLRRIGHWLTTLCQSHLLRERASRSKGPGRRPCPPHRPKEARIRVPPPPVRRAVEIVATRTPADVYRRHLADVTRERPGQPVDLSRVDTEIAVRMRLAGHRRGEIEGAIKGAVPADRRGETRVWDAYAKRTVGVAFGIPGDRLSEHLIRQHDRFRRLQERHREELERLPPGGPFSRFGPGR
jgi:hypothetical protein